MRKPVGEIYPSPDLLTMVVEARKPIALSSDAHVPEDVGFAYDVALEAMRAEDGVALGFALGACDAGEAGERSGAVAGVTTGVGAVGEVADGWLRVASWAWISSLRGSASSTRLYHARAASRRPHQIVRYPSYARILCAYQRIPHASHSSTST